MAGIANTRWYRQGKVTLTPNSTKVTGVNTNWLTAGINPGATFRVDSSPYAYEVAEVVSDTELTLGSVYAGNSSSNVAYSIDRNFQATPLSNIAADLSDLLRVYERIQDGVFKTIQGKSAYDLAKENGFTGTLTQWLESLKADNEWSILDERTNILTGNTAGLHNSIYRGQDLGGEITPEIMAAIRDGSYKNLWLGDYFTIGHNTYMIVHFGYFNRIGNGNENPLHSKPHVVLLLSPGYLYDSNGAQINVLWSSSSSIVPEGGYFASELAAAYEDGGVIMNQIEADLGADNIHPFNVRACSLFQNGECKEYTTKTVKACPPTEIQLFGEKIHSIEERDPYNEHIFVAGSVARNYCPGTWGMKFLREIASSTTVCINHYGRNGTIGVNAGVASEVQFMCVLA